jgi:hypothetical protein
MQIECTDPENSSRRGTFIADIEFQVRNTSESNQTRRNIGKVTFIRIALREAKRKWFSTNATDLAPEMLRDICDFLMISDDDSRISVERATNSNIVR